MALSAGNRIGPYEIVAALGAGGMGEIYRARDPRLGREVAIKVLPDAVALDAERLARFEREARVLAGMSHAGIASIFGVEEVSGSRALIMELVEGPTLGEKSSSTSRSSTMDSGDIRPSATSVRERSSDRYVLLNQLSTRAGQDQSMKEGRISQEPSYNDARWGNRIIARLTLRAMMSFIPSGRRPFRPVHDQTADCVEIRPTGALNEHV